MKKGFKQNIEKATIENDYFRKVLYTGAHLQLVLMSLLPGEEIGEEVHEENDQFFRFEQGFGDVIINETEYKVDGGDVVIVPAGAKHNVLNSGSSPLRFYTLYAPAHHKDAIVRPTRKDAIEQEVEFDGVTTE